MNHLKNFLLAFLMTETSLNQLEEDQTVHAALAGLQPGFIQDSMEDSTETFVPSFCFFN